MRKQVDDKRAEKITANMHMLAAAKPNKHTHFVDSDEDIGDTAETAAQLLGTRKELLNRQYNRPTEDMLKEIHLDNSVSKAQQQAYTELINRKGRSKQLGKVVEHLQVREDLTRNKV